jgi:hypothetical protein
MVQVNRSQKFVWGYPTEFAGSTQNHKKLIEAPNQPLNTIFFQKSIIIIIWIVY